MPGQHPAVGAGHGDNGRVSLSLTRQLAYHRHGMLLSSTCSWLVYTSKYMYLVGGYVPQTTLDCVLLLKCQSRHTPQCVVIQFNGEDWHAAVHALSSVFNAPEL